MHGGAPRWRLGLPPNARVEGGSARQAPRGRVPEKGGGDVRGKRVTQVGGAGAKAAYDYDSCHRRRFQGRNQGTWNLGPYGLQLRLQSQQVKAPSQKGSVRARSRSKQKRNIAKLYKQAL